MRKQLEQLSREVDWIETNDLYQAINNIKRVLIELIEHVDRALPLEIEPD